MGGRLAVSPTGVRGIMMLTEDTAAYLGIDDRVDPKNSIFGGAQYYARQTERVADSVDEPDRTWMALAAYNVGFNHLKDARTIAEWQGGDPNTWVDAAPARATQVVHETTLRLCARLGAGAVRQQHPQLLQHPEVAHGE